MGPWACASEFKFSTNIPFEAGHGPIELFSTLQYCKHNPQPSDDSNVIIDVDAV